MKRLANPVMKEVIDYKIKWVFIKGKAVKRTIPVYRDMGKGGGLEDKMSERIILLTSIETGRKIA